jgi:hypothetical protein
MKSALGRLCSAYSDTAHPRTPAWERHGTGWVLWRRVAWGGCGDRAEEDCTVQIARMEPPSTGIIAPVM